VSLGYEPGSDLQLGVGDLSDEPYDHVAGSGHRHSLVRYRGYPGDLDVVEGDVPSEDRIGQDGDLACAVVPLDVVGGVGLGVSELLRLLQSLVEGLPLVHLAEDVVAGPVEDSAYGDDLFPHEVLGAQVDDGHGSADGSLEPQEATVLLRQVHEVPVLQR
jgi:hypothetical protein